MSAAQVTEAHKQLAYAILFASEDGHAGPNEAAQLIADSEATAVAEWQESVYLKGEAIDSLLIECDRLHAEIKSCGELSCDECNARTAALIAERDQLRAIFPQICKALGNGSCCAPDVSLDFLQSIPNEVAGVVANLRAEVDAQCLLNAKGSEREAVLLGRVDRMAKECLNLRADLDAIKAIRNEETARAERAELERDQLRAEIAQLQKNCTDIYDAGRKTEDQLRAELVATLSVCSAETYRSEEAEHDCRVLIVELNVAKDELATERARLRQLALDACRAAAIVPLVWYPEGYYVNPNDLGKINKQQVDACVAAIDAAMKEGA